MPELEILVRELVTIDRLSSGAIMVGEVTTLRKEARKVSAAWHKLVVTRDCQSTNLTLEKPIRVHSPGT